MKRVVLSAWMVVGLFVLTGVARANEVIGPWGDEDPFPIACVDFSGTWQNDAGQIYQVEQGRCSWLKLKMRGIQETNRTMKLDGRVRSISGDEWRGTVRYGWNEAEYGTAIETNRVIRFANRTLTEFVSLEFVNGDLILETTYRVVEWRSENGRSPVVERANTQSVFRRQRAEGESCRKSQTPCPPRRS
jgi:hypothetical protein